MYEFPQVNPDRSGFEALMVLREGRRNDVYLDSKGKPTVGIGHLVLLADSLSIGDWISDAQIDAFFAEDSDAAWKAAIQEAMLAGINSSAFLPFLASVNFQLGTKWTSSWPHTWQMIRQGHYEMAAAALDGTPWQNETPVRVADFQAALRALPPLLSV
jgi:lysozyme